MFSDDLGIDLGTMNTLVCLADRGIVLDEPSVVACNVETGRVIAVGTEAKMMLGRAPGNIQTYRPVRNGVISDSQVTDKMLAYFIKRARGYFKIMQPRVLVAVPYGISPVESEAVRNSAHKAGARDVRLVAEPYAAAVGAGLPVLEPTGSMIVDIGGGTTEVAMISLGAIETAASIECGGDKMDEAIIAHMKKAHNLQIGERTAEDIKKKIGSACQEEKVVEMEVRGLDMGVHGNCLPRSVIVTNNEIQEALEAPITNILNCVRRTISQSQPSLAADLIQNGITLTGGGSLLSKLDYRLEEETQLPIRIAPDALKAVVNGTGELLRNPDALFSMAEDRTFGCTNKNS